MSRRLTILLVVLALLGLASALVAYTGGVRVYVDGEPLAAQAIISDGVTYVPLRAVSEAFGVAVEWDQARRSVYVGERPSLDHLGSAPSPAKRPAATQPKAKPKPQKKDVVHITRTGAKYHRAGCRYLSKSDIPIERSEAIARGYEPCKVCKP
jgi:hypothetical protein